MSISWKPKIITNLDLQTNYFDELLSGKIPAINVPKVLDQQECQVLVDRIMLNNEISIGLGSTKKIGESINSYISNKMEYFKNVKQSNHCLGKIFSHNDPREKMLSVISGLSGKEIQFAKEKSLSYSKGMIRIYDPGDPVHVHRDNASFEATNFSISTFSEQFSAVLHLQSARYGGSLTVFDKIWTRSDEKFRDPEFGYSNDVIDGAFCTSITCKQGDLVIINPNNYHIVNTVEGNLSRITFGFFFGHGNSYLSAWS